jgi:tetratricopeptide (TPR) repeat protein
MQRVAAGLAGAFVLVAAALWMLREPEPTVAAPVTSPRHDPLASRRSPGPAAAGGPVAPGVEARPFLDASGRGAAAYGAGDYASALEQYTAAVARNPRDAESLSNLGQVLVRLNRAAEAIPYFERAIALIPSRWTYQFNLARAHGQTGNWPEAVAGYRRAQALFPDDYATAFNLGQALHRLGDEAAAVEAYLTAIRLEPNDPSFRMALGISYERLQKPADAVAAYREALRLAPDAPDADKVTARIAELSGQNPAQPPAASGPGPGGI